VQRLKNRVALVTGAASGIGRATAETLAREGACVIATDRNEPGVSAVVAGIVKAGHIARALPQDVASETVWVDVIGNIRDHEGALHVLVNNAGIAWAGSILEMSLENWRTQQSVNLEGVFLGIRSAVPLMRDSGGGSIINVSSVAGLRGSATLAGYCATKGGVRLLTKGVALESARSGWNIRVNSVHPGIIDTNIWQTVSPAAMRLDSNSVDPHELAVTGTPGGKAGYPEDVANGILFLASAESSYMNGSELVIDMASSA
jgi:NAD(P)-dependent dehydrogenase (short-subunit alcohol dehydrogenase family)